MREREWWLGEVLPSRRGEGGIAEGSPKRLIGIRQEAIPESVSKRT